jgi:hypothetical protein
MHYFYKKKLKKKKKNKNRKMSGVVGLGKPTQ